MRSTFTHLISALRLTMACAAFLAFSTSAVATSIEERLAAPGGICMAGEQCASASAKGADIGGTKGPRSGEDVYNGMCSACHNSGASGAPKYGELADWADRRSKGIEALYENAIKGIGAMPAGGLCGANGCSEEEIKAAVDHILAKTP